MMRANTFSEVANYFANKQKIVEFNHPGHGRYFVHFDGEVYCITRDGMPTEGGYYSLQALFKAKF